MIVRAADPGNGPEAWRLSCRRFDRQDDRSLSGLLEGILAYRCGDLLEALPDRLAALEILVQRYEAQSGKRLSMAMRRAILMN